MAAEDGEMSAGITRHDFEELLREHGTLEEGDVLRDVRLERLHNQDWVHVAFDRQEDVDDGDGGERVAVDPRPAQLRTQLREKLPGEGELLEQRLQAVIKMARYLHDHGECSQGTLVSIVDVEACGFSDEYSLWQGLVKGHDTLSSIPGIQEPEGSRGVWTYTETRDGGDDG